MIRKITIVDGNPNFEQNPLNSFLDELTTELNENNFEVDLFCLQEREIKQCVGCFNCWWKTPGECRFDDDATEVLKSVINCDLVIYSSPMILGMYSALLKKFHDRTIPLVHPYIEIIQGECHHKKRYPDYPKMGVILEPNDSTSEEIEITRKIFNRIALNFHSEVRFFYLLNQIQPKKITDEISRI